MRDLRNVIIAGEHLNKREKRVFPLILTKMHGGVSPLLKLKIYEVLLKLCLKQKPFGMIVVLGWRREWAGVYASVPDFKQDLFGKHHCNLNDRTIALCAEQIGRTVQFDGAILVSRDGILVASGVYLENISVKRIAKKLHRNRAKDLSEAFGFETKVHTRHLAAIATSFILKGTTIFTVSEEDSSMRIFERGRIVWSTVAKEAKRITREFRT